MRVLVSAGPTREAIDAVRYITNASSGRQGYAVAKVAAARGHEVCLVTGPTELDPPDRMEVELVISADEMKEAVLSRLPEADVLVMVAAVADYHPDAVIDGKRRKDAEPWTIRLVPTVDVLLEASRRRRPDQILVGFALETEDHLARARAKRERKDLDMLVLNGISNLGGYEARVRFIPKEGEEWEMLGTKSEVASALMDWIEERVGEEPLCGPARVL